MANQIKETNLWKIFSTWKFSHHSNKFFSCYGLESLWKRWVWTHRLSTSCLVGSSLTSSYFCGTTTKSERTADFSLSLTAPSERIKILNIGSPPLVTMVVYLPNQVRFFPALWPNTAMPPQYYHHVRNTSTLSWYKVATKQSCFAPKNETSNN